MTRGKLVCYTGYIDQEDVDASMCGVALRYIKIKNSDIVVQKNKLEKISNEKDALETKIKKFENVSQRLDKLIGSQVTDNSKKGLGYVSYNAIPPPYIRRFLPPRINLSHTGLPEFADPSVQSYRVKPIKVARCKYHQRERMVNGTNHSRVNHNANKVPKAMLTRTGLKPDNYVRLVNPKRIFQSECYRHMTGNISYLTDFKEFDGGYDAFRGGAKGGKITGNGTIRTADESHVLLKFPRKNYMYSVDMKNNVPKKDLTCLVTKATNDASMLWHRRLGHCHVGNPTQPHWSMMRILDPTAQKMRLGGGYDWKAEMDDWRRSFGFWILLSGPHESFQCQLMNQNYFEPNLCYDSNSFCFNQPLEYTIDHQEDLNQQSMNDVDDRWNKIIKSGNKIIKILGKMDPEDSLIIGNEDLNTIPIKESDEFIKSSVEDLVPIPSKSEDTSGSDSEFILPSCDDFSPIDIPEEKVVTFSNPLFNSNDDFTSKNIESKDSYDSNIDDPDLIVTPLSDADKDECFDSGGDDDKINVLDFHHDPSIPKISIASILEGFTDEPPLEENNDLFDLESKNDEWKKILYNSPIDDLMISPDLEASRARGFVHRLLEFRSLAYGNPIC
nr:hypothetical protein [Tanacetum cinerariifolium]